MTHRRFVIAVAALLVLLLGAGTWGLWPRTWITEASFAQIDRGMTREEVEAILGGPAG